MHIVHLSSEYPPQQVFGLGRYVHDLAGAQCDQGHQVTVLTNSIGGRDADVVVKGVRVRRVDYPPPPKPPGQIAPALAFNAHLLQNAHEIQWTGQLPHVVVSHDWLTALAGHHLAMRLDVPHVWTVHDTVVGKTFGRLENQGDESIAAIERWAGKMSAMVVANSHAIVNEVTNNYTVDPSRIRLVHCGVDIERFSSFQSPERVAEFRRVWAEEHEQLVTYVGRLDPEKGVEVLLEAFAVVLRRRPALRLVLAGKGRLAQALVERTKSLGISDAVHFPGYVSGTALAHLYRVSDLHVCPSLYEPFGIVAVEALAAGCPLIASATGGLLDILENSDVGITVTPGDVTALAVAMESLLSDPERCQWLAAHGRISVESRFGWTHIAEIAARAYGEASHAHEAQKSEGAML